MWGIWHWLVRRADINPEKPALIDGTRTVTYRELAGRVDSIAAYLENSYGLRKGDRIAILSMNRTEYIETIFAAAWIGAIVVPLNWRLTPAELAFQVSDSEPKMMVVDPALESLVEELKARPEVSGIETYFSLTDPESDAFPWAIPYDALAVEGIHPPDLSPPGRYEDPLLIMYTSGTTGRPKGAVLSQATQFWNSLNIGTAIGLTFHDVTLNALPMFHTGGIGLYTLPSIHHGATAVLMRAFDPDQAVRLIATQGVTAMFAVPSMYLMLLQSEAFQRADLQTVRFASGGAPCPVTIIEAFERRGLLFQQGFGLTETSPTCTLIPAADAFRKKGSVGKATLHTELRVVDDDGVDVPPGEIGEVWTRGPNLFSEYWRRPDATAEAYARPAEGPTGPGYAGWWFKTGDLARIDDEGFVFIADRKKDMIISGGENIYPAEVEDVLYRHPAIAEVAVIGRPDPKWGEMPVAVVVTRPGQTVTLEDLRAFCQGRLARYKTPKAVEFVEALPRNAAGKVLKRVLRDQVNRDAVHGG